MNTLAQLKPKQNKIHSESLAYTDNSRPGSPQVKTITFLFELTEDILNIFMLKDTRLSLKNPDTTLFERGGKVDSVFPYQIAEGKMIDGELQISPYQNRGELHNALPGVITRPDGTIWMENPKLKEILDYLVFNTESFAVSLPGTTLNNKALPASSK